MNAGKRVRTLVGVLAWSANGHLWANQYSQARQTAPCRSFATGTELEVLGTKDGKPECAVVKAEDGSRWFVPASFLGECE